MSFIISVCKYTKNSKHLLLKSYLFVNFAIIRSKPHALFLLFITATFRFPVDCTITEWKEER